MNKELVPIRSSLGVARRRSGCLPFGAVASVFRADDEYGESCDKVPWRPAFSNHRNCYTFQMSRFIVIVLLALLPFQFTWATVAAYCGHESGVAAQHFGHHEHQHHADSNTSSLDGDAAGKAPGGNDLDCAHCHGSCSGIVSLLMGLMSPDVAAQPAAPVAGLVRTLVHSPPERPQWAPLA